MTDDERPSAKNLERLGTLKELSADLEEMEMTDTEDKDPGYCGLGKLTTGKRDPYLWLCSTLHDPAYEMLKAGHPDKTNIQVQLEFAKGVLGTAAAGLYAFLTFPIYLTIGVVGGMARWTQLEYRNDAKRGIKPPSNTPED